MLPSTHLTGGSTMAHGAGELGVVIGNPWLTWFKGAFLPALVGLAVTPLILYQAQPRFNLRYLSCTWLTRLFQLLCHQMPQVYDPSCLELQCLGPMQAYQPVWHEQCKATA